MKSGFVRPSIGEALTDSALGDSAGALDVADPERNPVAVAEIELGKVAVQVMLAAVLVDAAHPAFEDREEAFDGVGLRAL